MQHLLRRLLASLVLLAGLVSPASADVTRVAITSRTVVANGQWFGAAGHYEKIAGTVFFELDHAGHGRRQRASDRGELQRCPALSTGRPER